MILFITNIQMKRFKKKKKKERDKRLLKKFRNDSNSNLNMLISCASVIMIWRAIWDLCDTYIFPDNLLLSDIVCLIIWIVVLLIDDGKLKELV